MHRRNNNTPPNPSPGFQYIYPHRRLVHESEPETRPPAQGRLDDQPSIGLCRSHTHPGQRGPHRVMGPPARPKRRRKSAT